jgi:hypothetical protein
VQHAAFAAGEGENLQIATHTNYMLAKEPTAVIALNDTVA